MLSFERGSCRSHYVESTLGRGFRPLVRQTTNWMNECSYQTTRCHVPGESKFVVTAAGTSVLSQHNRTCRSPYESHKAAETFINKTVVQLSGCQDQVKRSSVKQSSTVNFPAHPGRSWIALIAVRYLSVNMHWNQLVIMSLSVDSYDISIDFYYPLGPSKPAQPSMVSVRWKHIFCSLAKNKFRVVHVIKRQQISHGIMRQCYSF